MDKHVHDKKWLDKWKNPEFMTFSSRRYAPLLEVFKEFDCPCHILVCQYAKGFLVRPSILGSIRHEVLNPKTFMISNFIHHPFFFKNLFLPANLFLVACTRLYNPLCPSVGWSVSRSYSFFLWFYFFDPTAPSLIASDLKYGPCPPACTMLI